MMACAPGSAPKPPASAPAAGSAEPDELAKAAEGDPELERALREAVKLERDKSATVEKRIAAWQAVSELAGDKPIAEQATDRVEEWSRVAEAAERRPEALRLLQEHYKRHISQVHHGAMTVQELCDGYAPHAKELLELGVDPPYARVCKGR